MVCCRSRWQWHWSHGSWRQRGRAWRGSWSGLREKWLADYFGVSVFVFFFPADLRKRFLFLKKSEKGEQFVASGYKKKSETCCRCDEVMACNVLWCWLVVRFLVRWSGFLWWCCCGHIGVVVVGSLKKYWGLKRGGSSGVDDWRRVVEEKMVVMMLLIGVWCCLLTIFFFVLKFACHYWVLSEQVGCSQFPSGREGDRDKVKLGKTKENEKEKDKNIQWFV